MRAVAFSGGADSVVAFHKYMDSVDAAIHINYNLRGEESKRDMQFCEDFCRKYKKDFIVFEFFNVEEDADANRMGVEEYARKLRYDIFNDAKYDEIILGHHADDLAETIIFRMIRGTGLNGIIGLKERNGKFYRPLLNMTKDDIYSYVEENGLEYVTDSTNLECDYTRNVIRNQIMPLMKGINEKAAENIIKLANRAENAYFKQVENCDDTVNNLISNKGVLVSEFNELDNDSKHLIILNASSAVKSDVFAVSEGIFRDICVMVERGNSGAYKIFNGVAYYVSKDRFYVEAYTPNKIEPQIITKMSPDDLEKVGVKCIEGSSGLFKVNGISKSVDITRAVVRNILPGDIISIDGMTKKVVQYLGDRGVVGFKRANVPVIAIGNTVFWAII